MFIKEISLHNFRIYKGENRIAFAEDNDRNIYVVSGYNGYGKTTFLTSLVWCLYGRNMQEVDDIFRQKIKEADGYLKYLESNLNRLAKTEEDYAYSVTLTLSDVNIPGIASNEIEISRSYTIGSKQDKLEVKIDGHRNELVEDVGNDLFVQDFILPKEIAKFFFFDAEKITAIAEIQTVEQKRQLGRAYSEVLGIKKYVDLRNNLTDLRLRYKRESASPEELLKLEKLEAEVQEVASGIKQRELLIQELSEDLAEKQKRSDELQEKLIREGSSISIDQLSKLRVKKKQLQESAKEYKARFNDMLDFAPFAIAAPLFFELGDQLNKEQAYKRQKSLSPDELQKRVDQINKAITALPDHTSREELERQFHSLLNEHLLKDKVNNKGESIKLLHEFNETAYNSFMVIASNLKSSYHEQFKLLSRDIKRNRYELNEVNKKLSRAESKENDILVQKHRKEKQAVDQEIDTIKQKRTIAQYEISSLTNEFNNKEKVKNELSKKLNVKEDLKEKDITAERLLAELDEFIEKIQKEKKETLERRIREGLNSLMHKRNFIKKVAVEVEGEIIDIDLYNERGEQINKEDLSMGEKQLYATAILQALVEESNIDFPVFIDSPMQKLDTAHAKNIIADFYPKVSKQVVVLPLLNKEMTEEEYGYFKGHVKSAHLIHNLHEDASTFVAVENDELFLKAKELERKEHAHV